MPIVTVSANLVQSKGSRWLVAVNGLPVDEKENFGKLPECWRSSQSQDGRCVITGSSNPDDHQSVFSFIAPILEILDDLQYKVASSHGSTIQKKTSVGEDYDAMSHVIILQK